MAKVLSETFQLDIPRWVKDLDSFRRWAHSDGFPHEGRICFMNGEVWADMSMEELISHNQVKLALDLGLGGYIIENELGLYMPDGMLMTNDEAKIGNEPDAMIALNETLAAKRVRFRAGKKRRAKATELVGSPDIVVEIVSAGSVEKDTDWLKELYWRSGVPEYWLIDARDEALKFNILKRSVTGYISSRKTQDWVKSTVLNISVRLLRREKSHGLHGYKLELR